MESIALCYLDRCLDCCNYLVLCGRADTRQFLVQFYEQDERYRYKARYATDLNHSDDYVQDFSVSNQDFEVFKAD